MNPFFSIIIPTYNRAGLLPVAIESILNQSFKEWELIIVDDGSKDNTRQVVAGYTDSRIKYIYQDNAERSAARNNGIKNSIGTYICFLDSDDYYRHDRLNRLYTRLQEKQCPVAFFYTGLQIENSSGISTSDKKQTTDNIYDHIAGCVIHSQQACVHRTIFSEFNYDIRFHIGEDMELWLRIADKYPFLYLDNEYTIVVVDHEERSVNVKRYNSYLHLLRMLKIVFSDSHPGHKISESFQKIMLSNCYFGIARYYIYTQNKWLAVGNLIKAILLNPKHFQIKYRLNILLKLLTSSNTQKAATLIE